MAVALVGRGGSADTSFVIRSSLRAGVSKVDITPPIGTPLAGFQDRTEGATGIRDRLHAAVALFDDSETRAAIVSLDLIGVGYDETQAIREALWDRADAPGPHVLVAASHNHAGPPFHLRSAYGRKVIAAVAQAASSAARQLRPVTLGYDEDAITFNVNRRLVAPSGIAEMRPNPDGPVDRRVKVLRLDDGRSLAPIAVVMHAVCHANVFRGENTRISADFPGEAQRFVERVYARGTTALFLQGPAGNVRPNLPSEDGFRNGDEADVQWAGLELGSAVVRACARSVVRDRLVKRSSAYKIKAATASIALPGKDGGSVQADLQALRVGDYLFLTIPGEPFVEYGFNLEKNLGARLKLFVVGYANGAIGYICTEESYRHMGYEPTSSTLKPEAEGLLLDALMKLAAKVL